MIHVLFVCLGNICRSPMAEAVFQDKVRAAGLDSSIRSDSVGTSDWEAGSAPHVGTIQVLKDRGIDYSHKARKIVKSDFDRFDMILTMDNDNYRAVIRSAHGKAEVRKFLEFAPGSGYSEVPDPWYTGNFSLTYTLVNDAAEGLLAYLRAHYKI